MMKIFYNTIHLVACIACFILFYVMTETYIMPVITSIEKDFHLPSYKTGLLISIKQACNVLVAVLFSHFLGKSHRPRILAIFGLNAAGGGCLYAIAHYVFVHIRPGNVSSSDNYTNIISLNRTESMLCLPQNSSFEGINGRRMQADECAKDIVEPADENPYAYVMLCIGSVMIGSCLGVLLPLTLPYLDDAVPENKTALCIGIVSAMRPLAPIFSFLLGGLFTQVHTGWPGPSATDDTVTGAWYLGFVVSPVLLALGSLWLACFPEIRPAEGGTHASTSTTAPVETQAPAKKIKSNRLKILVTDFAKAVKGILSNPVFIGIVIADALNNFLIAGMFPFFPKYMEIQFLWPASTANIITGVIGAFMAGVGVVIGSVIISKLNLSTANIITFTCSSTFILAVLLTIMMFLGCQQGVLSAVHTSACNKSCHCDRKYGPVCATDGVSYLSACHAGCSMELYNGTYGDCLCSGSPVEPGLCPYDCGWFSYAFLVVMALASLFAMTENVPNYTVVLRIIPHEDRTFGIGLKNAVVAMLTMLPGPVLYGAIIDSSCLLWQLPTCSGQDHGACLVYNNADFRWKLHGVTIGFCFASGIVLLITRALLVRGSKNSLEEKLGDHVEGNASVVTNETSNDCELTVRETTM